MKMDTWYGVVRWTTEDVISAAAENGVEMTEEQAAEWWKKNEQSYKNRMVELGNETLADMEF